MQFEAATPGVDVVLNLAGSQQLAVQLANGAPADLFASANEPQMQAAVQAGRVEEGAPQPFATNRLVIAVPADNPGAVFALADLATPGLKLVLADEAVPAGEYARQLLRNAAGASEYGAGFADAVLANVVSYEENVRSVLNKVLLGEADAGIVYTSDLLPDRADRADEVATVPIPDAFNVVATYPVAVVSDAPNPELARAFLDLLLSPAGQAVLADFGFAPAGKSTP